MIFRQWLGLSRLKQGLAKTRQGVDRLFGRKVVDDAWYEELESALILADAGTAASLRLVEALRKSLRAQPLAASDPDDALALRARALVAEALRPLAAPEALAQPEAGGPTVMMVVGVNGAGKTTTLGKLAHRFDSLGIKTLLAAGDTFRAAAREQLQAWGGRAHVEVISQEGADPAAVAFDAIRAGVARQAQVVMVDTAGRLPTQLHLMDELKKIQRTMGKAQNGAPHEVWLVLDGGTGQNAVVQARAFHEALGLTGLVITKLDGTAKGGVLLALAEACPVPVRFIGVGEAVEDLQPFDPEAFAEALLG